MKLEEPFRQHNLRVRTFTNLFNEEPVGLPEDVKCHPYEHIPRSVQFLNRSPEDVPQTGAIEAGSVDHEHLHFYQRVGKMKLLHYI